MMMMMVMMILMRMIYDECSAHTKLPEVKSNLYQLDDSDTLTTLQMADECEIFTLLMSQT